jgi:hypothetical protein
MKWIKKGRIFKTERQHSWMHSHAQCPTAIVLEDRIRIFFSARLENGQSLPTYIDVERNNPQKIIRLSPEPVLQMGRRGTFDENGIIPSYFIRNESKLYFYYAGWSQCKNVPYKNFTGLAISEDNGSTFIKHSEAPVFTLNQFDPLSATGPCIIYSNHQFIAIYSNPTGKLIIQPENEFIAHCKPAMIELNGIYHLWFSKRGSHNFRKPGSNAYRLGYAFSKDFINWTRDDSSVGIDVSTHGWDSEMICYPHIVKVENRYLMFYNGNGFGLSGFGYAELELN